MAEALSLTKSLWDLLGVTIRVNVGKMRQITFNLRERLRTVHVSLPHRSAGLRAVTALMVDWTYGGRTQESQRESAVV